MKQLFDTDVILSQGGKSNEWYTPYYLIEAAREVMGGIDLDPASCEEANQVVQAPKFYTKQENGLENPWHGRVWLNPPFTAADSANRPLFTWSKKFLREYEQGNIEEGILLVMALIKQKWFHELWRVLDNPICFSQKRILFMRPGLHSQELRESVCYIYVGKDPQKFIEVFSKFGTMAQRVSIPSSQALKQSTLWQEEESV